MTRAESADLTGLTIDRESQTPSSGGSGGRRYVPFAIAAVVIALVAALVPILRPKSLVVTVARAEALGGAPGAGASEVLTASGYIVARQRASVSSEVAGRLEALYVSEGSRVQKGDVLGVLRNEDQKAAVESAKAALASAQAASAEAKATARESALELARVKQLLAQGLVSQAEYDQAEAKDGVARARVESSAAAIQNATAGLSAAQIAYDKTFIRAPFSGAVLRKEAEVGEIVSPIPSSGGLTRGAIATMANLSTLEVEVDVNEGYVSRAHEGMRAEITLDAYPDRRYPGHARQIVPTADRQKATVQIKVSFDSLDTRVLPEMGAKVTFLADREASGAGDGQAVASSVVLIPRAAVREREGRAVVFVVEGGRAVERGVSPRPYGEDRVAVAGGLAAGENVVVEASADLKDKARVRVR
ncbi:MAG: efflux RND transporter periplasmic adaptor subunit [Candidatus Eiseniibacteriota bacterium]